MDFVGSDTNTGGDLAVGESWINGNPVEGRIEEEWDLDWYKTTLLKDHCYQVDVWGKTMAEEGFADGLTLEDPALEGIYQEDGYYLYGSTSEDGRGDNRTARHTVRMNKTGTYFISVGHDYGRFEGGGTFELSLIDLGTWTNQCTDIWVD